MDYPRAVLDKAQRLEQLLLRVAAGEPLDVVNAALGFNLDQGQLAHWQAKYEAGGQKWEALVDGRHGHPRKAHSALREWLYARGQQDEQVRAPQLAVEVKDKFGVELSAGHINYLLRKRGLTAPPGRPYKQQPSVEEGTMTSTAPNETVDNAGTFFPRSSQGRDGRGGGGRGGHTGGPGHVPGR
jgi:transposase